MGTVAQTTSNSPLPHERGAWRAQLLAARAPWLAAHPTAEAALARQLLDLLEQLEPLCLGIYWPLDGEFNAVHALRGHVFAEAPQLALPFAYKDPRHMEFRRWDGQGKPAAQDECGIPASTGAVVQPDVVLVPCVGFTREGYRLGYGGGYFDRWLAAHPGVTSVGLAWSCGEAPFAAEPHDQALTVVLTEQGVLS